MCSLQNIPVGVSESWQSLNRATTGRAHTSAPWLWQGNNEKTVWSKDLHANPFGVFTSLVLHGMSELQHLHENLIGLSGKSESAWEVVPAPYYQQVQDTIKMCCAYWSWNDASVAHWKYLVVAYTCCSFWEYIYTSFLFLNSKQVWLGQQQQNHSAVRRKQK